MHKLILRQLQRHLNCADITEVPESLRLFLEAVNRAYHEYDDAQKMLERSLELSSSEMVSRYNIIEKEKERAEQADKAKSTFLANMSHELRTPLNAIIGFSDVLLQGLDGDITKDQRKDIQLINYSGTHLLSLINNILDLSKIESGRMDVAYDLISTTEMAETVISISSALKKDKRIDLIKNISPELESFESDYTKVKQILLNLFSNAIKFTEKGSVTLFVRPSIEVIEFEVKDTGIGIKQKDIPVMFERFRQIDGSLTRKQGGTGLGMALVKEFISLLGGEMWVESKVKHGTSVHFTLPKKPTLKKI